MTKGVDIWQPGNWIRPTPFKGVYKHVGVSASGPTRVFHCPRALTDHSHRVSMSHAFFEEMHMNSCKIVTLSFQGNRAAWCSLAAAFPPGYLTIVDQSHMSSPSAAIMQLQKVGGSGDTKTRMQYTVVKLCAWAGHEGHIASTMQAADGHSAVGAADSRRSVTQ